jgi:hypothetical protein
MTRSHLSPAYGPFARSLAVVFLTLVLAVGAGAQGTIDSGTTITVRTNESINAKDSDGQVFSGVVEKDVANRRGSIAIPKGSDVELVVRNVSDNEVALDLQSVMVNGQRYTVQTDSSYIDPERKEGIGANKRTGKYVGGGALLGAVVGAIAGGGKGAAIGAGAGAAAGAGAQILTRGSSVRVPAESLLTFRLQQPLRTGLADTRLSQNDRSYQSVYGDDSADSPAYRAGMRAGRSDADRNLDRNTRSKQWTSAQDRRDYEAGYNRGYQSQLDNDNTGNYDVARVRIGRDNNITWEAPASVRVFVQVDNKPIQLFAEGPSGTQAAPWIKAGHVYVFMVRDMNGNELARDRLDTRQYRNSYRR